MPVYLTANDVIRIRRMYKSGLYSQIELGVRFGVHSTTIGSALNGRTWSSVNDVIAPIPRQPKSRLTWDDVRRIRKLHKKGSSQGALARKYKVSRQTIRCIINEKYWKERDSCSPPPEQDTT